MADKKRVGKQLGGGLPIQPTVGANLQPTVGANLQPTVGATPMGVAAQGQRFGMKHGSKRKGYKHGKWVKAPVPHADIDKYVDKQTGKEDDDKPGSRFRQEGSTMKFKKPRRSAGPSAGRPARPKGGWTD